MYAAALLLSAATTAGTIGMPFFQLGALDVGIPIQAFGVIVAAGVLIGAAILRRYAEWHGVSDEHIRGVTGWITVTGFIGAHVFDVVAYQWDALERDPLLLLKVWSGISSYGGFLGGAMGFAFYVWWKRLPARLMADIAIVGLLPAFSIGRIGCTVVSDHVGAAVDPSKWYAFLAMDYPRYGDAVLSNGNIAHLAQTNPGTSATITAWNLGFIEFLYLVPVNALILLLAFRKKRIAAGLVTALAGVLYAPVRFFLDYLRPENSDPRHLGLTFAQWSSLLALGVTIYFASRLIKGGKPADTIAPTAGEAQAKLRVALKEDVTEPAKPSKAAAPAKPAEPDPVAEAKRLREEKEEAEAAERRRKQDEALAAKSKAAKDAAAKDAAEKAVEQEAAARIAPSAEEPVDEGAEVDAGAVAEAGKPAPE